MSKLVRKHARVEASIGYRFADQELLAQALTHTSAVSPAKRVAQSYQRLEFLGDRVLGLVVADMLTRKFPKHSEGDLNRSFVTLVRGETCAAIARELNLGPDIVLGDSERKTGGADNDTILGDVVEALFGAVYLDGGLAAAYELIEGRLAPHLETAVNLRPDAKTTLQEWAQAQGLEPPLYRVVDRTGPQHLPEFTIAVELPGYAPLPAIGSSKKIAEHKAAEAFLFREKIWRETP